MARMAAFETVKLKVGCEILITVLCWLLRVQVQRLKSRFSAWKRVFVHLICLFYVVV